MIATFHTYREDQALLVTEDGHTRAVPVTVLHAAGLGPLRIGQRLVIELTAEGTLIDVRLP